MGIRQKRFYLHFVLIWNDFTVINVKVFISSRASQSCCRIIQRVSLYVLILFFFKLFSLFGNE